MRRIDDILKEWDERENENDEKGPLIDEIRLGLCLNYCVFLYEIKN